LKGDVLEKDRKVVLNYQHFERLIQVTQQWSTWDYSKSDQALDLPFGFYEAVIGHVMLLDLSD
jgi:hypothetical protein